MEFSVEGNTYTVEGLTTSNPSSTNVCSLTNAISGTAVVKDAKGNDVTNQFTVHTTNGTLEIKPATLTITVTNQTTDYNGEPQGETGTEYTGEALADKVTVEGLQGGDKLTGITLTGQGTYAGEYPIVGSDANISGDLNNYTVVIPTGTLTINKVPLTITAKDQQYTYNGSPKGEDNATYTEAEDIANKVTVEGLQGSDALTSITLNGQETSVGVYEGKIEPSAAAVGEGGAATGSYDITYVKGKLTIKKKPDDDPVPPDLNGEDHMAYVEGYPDGTVQPNGKITRAETATMLYRLLTAECRDRIFTDENDFSDVEKTNWYNKAVSSMANGSFINGYPDGTFLGNQTITRAEFVTIMVRFLGSPLTGSNPFSDVEGHWAEEAITTAVQAG